LVVFFSKTRKDKRKSSGKIAICRSFFGVSSNSTCSQIAGQSGNNDAIDYGRGNVHRLSRAGCRRGAKMGSFHLPGKQFEKILPPRAVYPYI